MASFPAGRGERVLLVVSPLAGQAAVGGAGRKVSLGGEALPWLLPLPGLAGSFGGGEPLSPGGARGGGIRCVSLAEDEQHAAQQSLPHVLGAQAAGQAAQQGQEVPAGQAGSGQQQARQEQTQQQREQRRGHGWAGGNRKPGLFLACPGQDLGGGGGVHGGRRRVSTEEA